MSDKKYWQSFAELNNKEEVQKLAQNEFAEDLPFEDLDDKGLFDSKTPRRDFLKYLGFSTAAATLAASCETPVRKAMPYVNRPENVTPGIARYFASTYVQDGDVVPVVVKVRDGRPIKIEGNELYPFTKGGTSARAQASVLDLYDMYRLPHPKRKSGNKFQEIPTFDQLDTQINNALAGLGGAPVVLLTSTVVSPTTKQVISEFLAKYPGSRHVQYDAISYSGLIQANGGKIPAYQFDRAKVIVSLGADFLGTWLSPVEFARQYAVGRKIDEKNVSMSKHYQFESYLSMTGSCADERFTHRPSELGQVALALLGAVGGQAPAVNFADANLRAGIQKVANDLKAHNGAALVVCGSNDPNVQAVVTAINSAIGATIDPAVSLNNRQGIDADMVNLVNQMNAGQVGALFIYGANPVYDYFDADKFKTGLSKVRLSISFNEKLDETTELCQYSVPTHHYLESWGDAEPRTGYICFIQPTINPLFKTRPFQTSLLKWSGNNTDYETYFRNFWMGKVGGQAGFDKVLQDGVLAMSVASPATTTSTANTGGLPAAITAITGGRKGGKTEVILYQNVAMGTGRQGGNPWLLEVPDPVTRSSWDNYAMISTKKAEELGINYKDVDFEYYPDKPIIDITVGNKKVSLPALVIPGMQPDTIAVAVGYGRSENYSKATQGVGKNVYPLARWNGSSIEYANDVNVALAGDTYKVARVQVHNSYDGRTEVVKETSMASFMLHPDAYKEWREELHKDFAPATGDYRKEGTLYGDHVQPGPKWGMSIDMNLCIGCHACVVACHLENNVPVVGKSEVLRYHDMHWLRIDRYFVSDENNPDNLKAVVFQPMLCQHCDNAPCENVCPVAATMHNSEGVNQMAYNRCIGTRYCANNCPYKVRRFNWGDYTGASTHGVLGPSSGVGELDPVVHQMNDELTRMVLNPDVVTRSRGVMEKCSFCVQRTQAGKLQAKMENRPLGGDDVITACAQACPTNAITFSNVNDKTSTVSKIREQNPRRLFYVLEQIHTLPNVSYLAKIRNTQEVIQGEKEGAEHAQQQTHEPVPSEQAPASTEAGH
ncbi:TAT-variant-translocated molybdopterin oxidoreductase [Flavisolibacter ginsengisoli]|jgi:molybdopterin-containing oxidoreductase family iron-sulfur binding subunit|uniref:Prokaryotic molybdopterin-containing oxidoreductase family, iron-sulfur binding subunit n=1 Tax=Flavisolibacter ginsengisoli DSM 18119 TaxID=1121884 RepID=A0A1M4Y8Q4_9BACT|nr:TAT-variant-translocated molybdopterin oxidoreductase [Flavisolibacter ginsengisoli]SHF02030.1 prokaryotic molybdopterin-containing oxidoreductase family, iron-sulfur binding subunit [Flavisolibacter ginsengisoli DSM 18119]